MCMIMFVQQIKIIPTAQWKCIEVLLIISAHAKAHYSFSISLQVLSKFSGSCFHKSDIDSKTYINHKWIIYKQAEYTYFVILKPVRSKWYIHKALKRKKRKRLKSEAGSFLFLLG